MRFGTLIGWGITIYAIMALSWSGLIIYGLSSLAVSHGLQLVILVTLALIAGRALKLDDWRDVLPYSFGWVIVMILLDLLYSAPFGGWHIFSNWNLWLGYGIVLVVPLLAPFTRRSSAPFGA